MIVSILADLSVLMSAVLFFFLAREDRARNEVYTHFEIIKFSGLVTLVGVLLMKYSVVVDGARYDYRFLLYSLSMKFLGTKITVLSIVLITFMRLFWGVDIHMFSSLVYGIVLLITLPFINKGVKKINNDFIQVITFSMYNLFVGAFLNLIIYKDFFKDGQLYFVLSVSSIVMVYIFMWIRNQIAGIYHKSEVDYLTNLLNSRRFYLDLTQTSNESGITAICMIDIDFFKKVNDRYGHLAGDDILRQVSNVFLDFQDKESRFYRVGGEEFACLMKDTSVEQAVQMMNDVRQKIASIDTGLIDKDGKAVQVTVSAGLASIDSLKEIHQYLRQADDALYHSKETGRNRVSFVQGDNFVEV